MADNKNSGWIGERPTPVQFGAILLVGVCGVLIAGLQPLLLGTLAQEGRITANQLGHAATAELLLMGTACAYAGARWKAERLRAIGVVASLLLAALNLLTLRTNGEMVTLVRALAGIPSGIMIWITIAMITRSPTPERWSGIYLTLQTLAQFVIAAALTTWVAPFYGANGGFVALAVVCAVTAAVAFVLPDHFAPLIASANASGLPGSSPLPQGEVGRSPGEGWLALAAIFLFLAFIVGVWVYAEPLSRQAGHAPSVAGVAVSASLAFQVLGGATATLLAGRLRWFPTILVCSLLNVGCLLSFAALPGESVFIATSAAFGFLWLFVLPFLVPMVIAADPTRRAAVLVGGAELLGASLGPLLVSFIVTDSDARGAIAFGAGALVLALLIAAVLHRRESRTTGTMAEIAD